MRNSKGQFIKGVVVWNKGLRGIHLSPNTEFKKGHKLSFNRKEEQRKIAKERGFGKWMKGRKLPEEWRNNIGKASSLRVGEKSSGWKGGKTLNKKCNDCGKIIDFRSSYCRSCSLRGERNYNFGKKLSNEHKTKIGQSNKGKVLSEKTKLKISLSHKGNRTWNWKGGITPLQKTIRRSFEYRNWRKQIFERDNYTCQGCKLRGGTLHPHHNTKSFATIFQEFLQTYSQFSPIEDKETLTRLAVFYQPFWDINNGQTLCVKCHRQTKNYKKLLDAEEFGRGFLTIITLPLL